MQDGLDVAHRHKDHQSGNCQRDRQRGNQGPAAQDDQHGHDRFGGIGVGGDRVGGKDRQPADLIQALVRFPARRERVTDKEMF